MRKYKLIPPDKKRCQAQIADGSCMSFGPRKFRQCNNIPTVIVREKKKDQWGRRGSMSLCDSCLSVAKNKLGKKSFTTKKI